MRFAQFQYSQRLHAWCNSCKHCNALLYVFDRSFVIGGGAIAFNCALAPKTTPQQNDHSKRANEHKTPKFNHANDNPRNACAFCGGNATLQTRCKHCSKNESATINSPKHVQRADVRGNKKPYVAPEVLRAFTRTVKELNKPQLRYTYASTQRGTYTAPCLTECTVRHVYLPPITTGKPDHVLAVYECRNCANYECIAVMQVD